MVDELILSFEVLTPLFMGGASQAAELRPPSFKGLLRFWYRAVDPGFNTPHNSNAARKLTREEYLFGGSDKGAGQSSFFLRINYDERPVNAPWDKSLAAKFKKGNGKKTRNGLVYLGFPFHMSKGRENGRVQTAIQPGSRFTVSCIIRNKYASQQLRRALLASWWCLSHLGGAGSRARRGFGGLILKAWRADPEPWPELSELPLLSQARSGKEWSSGLFRGLQSVQNWFGIFKSQTHHPHLGDTFKVVPLPRKFGLNEWAAALDHAGLRMQAFRAKKEPDYSEVRDHLLARSKRGGRFLEYAPTRATFGLPLSLRFPSVGGEVEFLPYNDAKKATEERHGSLLYVRLAALADCLYPIFVRLTGDVPGIDPPATVRGRGVPLKVPRENAMDRFLDSLIKKG